MMNNPQMTRSVTEPIGIYIHIPFCERKCHYCDFYSVVGDEALKDQYLEALFCAIEATPKGQADSLYLGGGTPTLFGAERLTRLLQAVQTRFSLTGEVSLEANPNTVDLTMLQMLRKAGFNRISFGAQSTDERQLQTLGRTHKATQVTEAVLWAAAAGFDDISVDLMIGLPDQTWESLQKSIADLTALPITHLSAYLLKVEEGTAFDCKTIVDRLPDEDAVSDWYLATVAALESAGFFQYEISNFAKEGYPCKHNLKYWQVKPYLAFGPTASGFVDGVRYRYPRDLQAFLETCGRTVEFEEICDLSEERVMLGLRLTAGIPLAMLGEKKGMHTRLQLFQKTGLLTLTEERVALTPKGFLLSNGIIADLLGRL